MVSVRSMLVWLAAVSIVLGALLGAPTVLGPATGQVLENPSAWRRGTLPTRLPAPDLSFLNHKPAGALGRVSAQGSDLIFADGTPARFWGINLQAYALFRTKQEHIKAHAKRIAALGFNLVRIHHHDSNWVSPNIFGKKAPATTQLYPPSQRQLDLWISALKAVGVYIWLDLHVGRRVTAQDEIEDFEEIAKGNVDADIRGFSYVSQTIQQRMLEFQKSYLSHVNSITGLSYAEDPAIIAVQISNENDLTHHFGNSLLPNKGVPAHSAIYMSLAQQFAKENGLNSREIWQAWEHGSPKIFLNDLEHRFNERMIAGIKATGFSGLIATTSSWGRMSVAGLPSLTSGSIIDIHSYGHPDEIGNDPRITPGLLDWIAAGHVTGMPLSISEWNVAPFPVEDRFITPLRMATSAAHQGWDAPIVYGYAQQPLNKTLQPSNWDIASDPGMIAMMPAAALLYRQGHIRPAKQTYVLRLEPDAFFGAKITPETSVAIRTLLEQSQLMIELPETPTLPWLTPVSAGSKAILVTDPNRSYLPKDATEIVADTGEFRRNFARSLFTVNTARTQIAAGRLGGGIVHLSDIDLLLETPLAAVAVQSLDDAPIRSSKRIMISLSARAIPTGKKQVTYQLEPMRGQVRIRANPALSLRQPTQGIIDASKVHRLEGTVHVIDLAQTGGANWLVLE